MASTLQTVTISIALVSLLLGCAGMRYIPNSSNTTGIKYSDFLVNIVHRPSGLIPGLGRFLLPPKTKKPFHFHKAPLAASPMPAYEIPSSFAPNPNPGYEAQSPSSEEDQVPPVPQP